MRVYKGVAFSITSACDLHMISLSITDKVRYRIGSHDEAINHALEWIDELV